MAIAYDFDGTLAPGNIQENSFIPEIGMKKASFWQQNKKRAEKHEADEVLSYMTFMLERASAADVPVRRVPEPSEPLRLLRPKSAIHTSEAVTAGYTKP